MKALRSAAIVIVLVCSALFAYSQGTTSSGTEFWTAYMDHVDPPTGHPANGDPLSQMVLYITSAVNTSGTVQLADGSFSQAFNVTANQITTVNVPATAFLGTQGTFTKGIHITSLKPISIYAHIFAANSSGATLLLPVNTLGKDYYSINYKQTANEVAYSAFVVIATEDSTTVQITPTAQLLDGKPANQPFLVTLQKGQLYQGLSTTDLTGTRIQSISSGTNTCKKIAVFSGSSKIAISCNPQLNTSDNLFQQVYPTASWGKNYITVPLAGRNYDIFRIVLSTPQANVYLNGTLIPLSEFTNGLYYQFNSQIPNYISSDEPIQVVQYAVSQGNTINCGDDPNDVGDPEMIYLTPLEQTLSKVTLYSTPNFAITESFINVTIPKAGVSSFIFDGAPYTKFSPVKPDSSYYYSQIAVSTGTHNISATTGFNAIAYGFGNAESYGYAAGANLQDLAKFIALQNPQTQTSQTNGCTGVKYNLQITLPYKTTNIQWDFMDGSAPYVDSAPVIVDSVKIEGQTAYVYNYPKNPVVYKSGSYSVVATVFNPVADVCGSTETIEFDFNITDPPVANFTYGSTCLGDSTLFTDKTTGASTLKSWLWNFGDGKTSTLQNPVHKYLNPGDYSVSLTVTDIDSCTDTFVVPDVHISKKPVASFTTSTPNCAGQAITFTDQSTTAEGTIAQWIWSFGDGATDTINTKTPTVNHIYSDAGTDTVKLTVVNSNGCRSLVFAYPLIINPDPVVDFTLPDVCLADSYAQFTDKSTIADNTQADFTYLWNFGDPNATAANPNTSTLKNPTHKYTAAANYNVTLTVTSKYGCSISKTLPFTVNGSFPQAAFSVQNMGDLCSSDSVAFVDQSTVDFGSITKIVWYYDYNNNPQDTVVYYKATMPANKTYRHNYGVFNTPASQTYEIRMDVYSGESCVNSTTQNIVINANPVVTLSQIGSICQGASPVAIVPDIGTYSGQSAFSGPGVSSSGLFDPAAAGVGTATINYTFTAQNGCGYTTSEQIIVNPEPTVSADSTITLLEGNSVKLNISASGDGLTYKWTPSADLSNDSVQDPVASPVDDTKYTVTVTNSGMCSATANVYVKVLKKIVVPNAFTPNGDGINDYWDIKYLSMYPNCTVDIFDRYGQKVYSSVGYSVPWDGTYKGANLPTGTYYYIINPKNGRTAVSGYVAIIR